MPARRVWLAGACVAAAGSAAWLLRGSHEANAPGTDPPAALAAFDDGPPVTTTLAPPREPLALARLAELRALSETYRNTTFLTAIRAGGFVCYELGSVYGGLNDSTTWTVNCADMLAYTVRVDAAGQLVVEPTAQYLDRLPPTTRPDDRTPRESTLPPPR